MALSSGRLAAIILTVIREFRHAHDEAADYYFIMSCACRVEAGEEERVVSSENGGFVPSDIATGRWIFDRCYFGPRVSQLHRPEWARAVLFRDDAEVRER